MSLGPMSTVAGSLRLGWPGRLGLVLAALSLAGYLAAVAPAQQRLQEIKQRAETLQIRAAGGDRQGMAIPLGEQLLEFYRFFPNDKEFVDWIAKLAAIANDGGVSLDQADYAVAPDVGSKLSRYQVTLPIRGDYRQIRRFLSALGTEIPIVALEEVQFERQKVGDSMVNARIRLTFFLVKST